MRTITAPLPLWAAPGLSPHSVADEPPYYGSITVYTCPGDGAGAVQDGG